MVRFAFLMAVPSQRLWVSGNQGLCVDLCISPRANIASLTLQALFNVE